MTTDKNIRIQNLFYMLSYAFRVLNQTNYDEVRAEEFEDAEDLFAAVLAKGIAQQVKHGLYRSYRTEMETLSVMRGKLHIPETIRKQIQHQQKLSCEFDELTENNRMNQILKTTIQVLLQCSRVKPARQRALKRLLLHFGAVDSLVPGAIPWTRLRFERNNRNYEMLLNLCYLVLDSLLQTTESGDYKLMGFSDDQMAKLYETFILEYYRKHHPYLDVRAGKIPWDLREAQDQEMLRFLPQMQTDILLRCGEKTLIIDAKYYGHVMQQQFSKYSLHSGNLYQIYTYVKNLDTRGMGNVAGVLLYARTEEKLQPDCAFNLGGNWIAARTLDLNRSFSHISHQLDQLAFQYFGEHQLHRDK